MSGGCELFTGRCMLLDGSPFDCPTLSLVISNNDVFRMRGSDRAVVTQLVGK